MESMGHTCQKNGIGTFIKLSEEAADIWNWRNLAKKKITESRVRLFKTHSLVVFWAEKTRILSFSIDCRNSNVSGKILTATERIHRSTREISSESVVRFSFTHRFIQPSNVAIDHRRNFIRSLEFPSTSISKKKTLKKLLDLENEGKRRFSLSRRAWKTKGKQAVTRRRPRLGFERRLKASVASPRAELARRNNGGKVNAPKTRTSLAFEFLVFAGLLPDRCCTGCQELSRTDSDPIDLVVSLKKTDRARRSLVTVPGK